MTSKHRKRSQAAKRVAAMGVATATATALVVGGISAPQANAAAVSTRAVSLTAADGTFVVAELAQLLNNALFSNRLAATPAALAATPGSPGLPSMPLAPGAPEPASIPDLTFGLGTQGYNQLQTLGAGLETAILNNINLSGVLQNLGFDPETAINTALGNALTQALAGVAIPVDQVPVIGGVLSNAGVTNAAALLSLLGLNLSDPLGLSGPTPGLNIITAGPPFSLLKFLGIDLGWVPGFPNSVADEVNGTPYLGISPVALLQTLKGLPGVTDADKLILDPLILTAQGIFGNASAVDVRVPIVIGFGLGAFAAGQAYPQVVADLQNQPGGAAYTGTSPLAGSLTILPMILLRNPGRANGGLFARGYPLAGLLGIDTVTPDTAVSSSSDGTGLSIPVGNTGIVLGDANLIPIKVDATVEYDPLSDFPAWPNPVSLANSAAALLFPTYLLRGITAASLTQVVNGQLTPQLAAALASNPLALNLYLTVPVNDALPLLEPIKLPIDLINLFTGANLNNPIATALEPALTSLVNLGYTDVQRTVVNGVPQYTRTLDQANVITPFGTLPSGVDWGQVPGDLLVQLVAGIQRAITGGLVSSTPVVNPLAILANLIGLNGLPGAANAVSPVSGLTALTTYTVTTAADVTAPAVAQSNGPAARIAPNALAGKDTDTGTGNDTPTVSTEPQDSETNVTGPETGADTTTNVTPVTNTPPASNVSPAAGAQPGGTVKATPTAAEKAAKRAQARADAAAKKAANHLDKILKDGQEQIQNVLKDAHDAVEKTGKTEPATDKSTDGPSDNSE